MSPPPGLSTTDRPQVATTQLTDLPTEILLQIATYCLPTKVAIRCCNGYHCGYIDALISTEARQRLSDLSALERACRRLHAVVQQAMKDFNTINPATLKISHDGSAPAENIYDWSFIRFISKFNAIEVSIPLAFGQDLLAPGSYLGFTAKRATITVIRNAKTNHVSTEVHIKERLGLRRFDYRMVELAHCEDAIVEAAVTRVTGALLAKSGPDRYQRLCRLKANLEKDWRRFAKKSNLETWFMLPMSTDWGKGFEGVEEVEERKLGWVGRKREDGDPVLKIEK